MAVEQFRDGRHPTNSMRMPGFPLVGLRSKTSLGGGRDSPWGTGYSV
jgi:hypothetical protein